MHLSGTVLPEWCRLEHAAWYTTRKLRTRKAETSGTHDASLQGSDITYLQQFVLADRDLGSPPTSTFNTLASWFQAGHFLPFTMFPVGRTPGGQTGVPLSPQLFPLSHPELSCWCWAFPHISWGRGVREDLPLQLESLKESANQFYRLATPHYAKRTL